MFSQPAMKYPSSNAAVSGATQAQRKPSSPRSQPNERANRRERRARENHHSPEFAHGFHWPQFYLICEGNSSSWGDGPHFHG